MSVEEVTEVTAMGTRDTDGLSVEDKLVVALVTIGGGGGGQKKFWETGCFSGLAGQVRFGPD